MIDFDKSYDSHVHFFGVGLAAVDWIIEADKLKLPNAFKDKDFVRGFGITKRHIEKDLKRLSEQHPNKDFCLSYTDGHSALVTKSLLKKLNFQSTNSIDHGHFVSLFEIERDRLLKKLPPRSEDELYQMAKLSFQYFKKRGVKKIRHMTCTERQWRVLNSIYSANNPPDLMIHAYFAEFMNQNFHEAFAALNFAKNNPAKGLKAEGLKLFVDGSIGQNTAYMSNQKQRQTRVDRLELKTKMHETLSLKKCPLALHTIGDLALQEALELYQEIQNEDKRCAHLDLEHAPIFTTESLKILSQLKVKSINFHFQPSHWINDRKWYLNEKKNLKPHKIYPFKELKDMGYGFFFGSDAPIEESHTDLTEKGLKLIEEDK